jgi:hypothetical protein
MKVPRPPPAPHAGSPSAGAVTLPEVSTLTLEASAHAGFVTDPVLSLWQLPGGPMHLFDDFRWEDEAKAWLSIGSSPYRDITLVDRAVSRLHCLLGRVGLRVFAWDQDSKNRTFVNGIPISGGVVELRSGNLLTLGCTTFLACGERGERQEVSLTASSLDHFLRAAVQAYGTQERAASALGLWPGTLSRWLRRKRFARAERPPAAHKRSA